MMDAPIVGQIYKQPEYVSIYALADPDTGRVRYVGKARYPELRVRAHIKSCLAGLNQSPELARWLRGLVARGKMPVLKILASVLPADADAKEAYYISAYGGLRELTNGVGANSSRGQKKRTKGVQFTAELADRLEKLADDSGINFSELIRRITQMYLKEVEREKDAVKRARDGRGEEPAEQAYPPFHREPCGPGA